jgi:hypothetical protein
MIMIFIRVRRGEGRAGPGAVGSARFDCDGHGPGIRVRPGLAAPPGGLGGRRGRLGATVVSPFVTLANTQQSLAAAAAQAAAVTGPAR